MKLLLRWNSMKIRREVSLQSLLSKFRSGFRMLSNIEWVSAYGSHLSMATVLGVVGLILAVRDGRMLKFNRLMLLSPGDASSEKLLFVPGLRNLGNNCFLNVALQSLASCSSFRSFLEEVEELHLSSTGKQVEDLPLLVPLTALLEDLSTLQDRSRSLNPRTLMSAMQQYIPQFKLTNEQDAEEALIHLLSCLRDELSESFMPNCGSLADVTTPTCRVLASKSINDTNEPERWRHQYIGPFDGILGSFLTCQSCSSEILMDFGFFHTLPLSLMVNGGPSLLGRFTLEDCIKRFLAPEHLENYFCSRCWHSAAVKFLSSVEGHQEEIRKLSCCSEQDSCDCKTISSLLDLPWSNRFSRTFKQLSIARCPQILCLHLQRTSVNAYGELVKIQGHIHFPLILNMSPFVKHELGTQKRDVNKDNNLAELRYLATISHPGMIAMHSGPTEIKDDISQNIPEFRSQPFASCASNKYVHPASHMVAPKNHLYRLVSVVEHFGIAGSGHYTVYRGVRPQIVEADDVKEIGIPPLQWFCISDSEVQYCLEGDVLGADASLLFYERI